mmetsp:Transcript_12475/g.16118  ORF Transcript_12475/g.16118 Transcript_12475/m.16118 type:complete len:85 (+) Transcript_12475:65-319(+)
MIEEQAIALKVNLKSDFVWFTQNVLIKSRIFVCITNLIYAQKKNNEDIVFKAVTSAEVMLCPELVDLHPNPITIAASIYILPQN